MKDKSLIYLLFISLYASYGQVTADSIHVRFIPEFKNAPLEANKKYISANNDTITIETFRFYLGNIKIGTANNEAENLEKNYHLIDFSNRASMEVAVKSPTQIENSLLQFEIGVDSLQSVSGALAGDLDPMHGMYWAWNSGYINIKLEGTSSSCYTRKNRFQFHIGGYAKPNCALQKLQIPLPNKWETKKELVVRIDLANFFSYINLSTTNSVMIPGKEALALAETAKQMFKLE